jgi:hypothetical protein
MHRTTRYVSLPAVANKTQPTLGPHRTGKGCVYVKRLSDVDERALVELIQAGAEFTRAQHVAP